MTESQGGDTTAALEAPEVPVQGGSVDLVKAPPDGPAAGADSAEVSGSITFQSMADRLTLGLLAAVIGSVLVFVSSFLTWATVDSRSSTGKELSGAVTNYLGVAGGRLGLETLVLSIAALATVGVMLLPATKPWAWLVLLGAGVLIVLFSLIDLQAIPRTLRPDNFTCPTGVICSFHRSIGPGVLFSLISGLVVVAGAYVHHIRPVTFRPSVAEPSVAEPSVAEPSVAEPPVAEPSVAEAAVAEPSVAEAAVAEPSVAEAAVAEPSVAEAAAAQPPAAEAPDAAADAPAAPGGGPA